ncbi:hypothetical protein KIW84_012479 [Lathyrus oleraceus]|uniref:Uncharacterized protein n=1 Tax=Pisum sativum TaxID=3888 RepID=A0A9D5BHL0_PEA|nr:hypothetical protein KIW84_012479 [Pisum sativum]
MEYGEYGEYGARRRRTCVSYKCTKCDKFGHNALSCKSITHDPNPLKIKANATQTDETQPDGTQSFFGDISAEVMSTLPDIKTDVIPYMVKQHVVQRVEYKPTKNVKKHVGKIRKKFQRLKLKWFQKPIIGLGSNSDQPITITENDACTLTQEDFAMVSNFKHGTCVKSKKSRNNKSKNPSKYIK